MSDLPTKKQWEAYRLVIVKGCKHREAAEKMGICRSEVTRLISRFYSQLNGLAKKCRMEM